MYLNDTISLSFKLWWLGMHKQLEEEKLEEEAKLEVTSFVNIDICMFLMKCYFFWSQEF